MGINMDEQEMINHTNPKMSEIQGASNYNAGQVYGGPMPSYYPQQSVMPSYYPQQPVLPRKKPVPEKLIYMRENFDFFGIATIIYAVFYTFCLYKNLSGITAPFFVAGTLCYFYLCLKKLGVSWKKDIIFYMIAVQLVGINLCMTRDSILIGFDYVAIVLLTISGLLHLTYDDKEWEFGKYFSAIIETVFGSVAYLFQCFVDMSKFRKEKAIKENTISLAEGDKQVANSKPKEKVGKYIWIGFFCCLPILGVVLLLLASADAMFAEVLANIANSIHIDENIFGIIFMIFLVYISAYALLCKMSSKSISVAVDKRPSFNAIIAITMNVMLAVVYLLFCAIQLNFLFRGENMQLPEGYTYSSYARQGFFQLLFVCLINMILVLICLYYFRENNLLKGILTFITVCTYIMIASSALRMKMYIEIYQMSYLRLLVLWGLAIIFFMMTGILIYIYQKGFPLFRYGVAVVTILYLALAFARPEVIIAKYNLSDSFLTDWQQSPNESKIDFEYLRELSTDAAPTIVEAIETIDDVRFTNRFTNHGETEFANFEMDSYLKFNFSADAARIACERIW